MDYEYWIKRFDLKNSSLPMLASEAAVDIDNYISGRGTEDESTKYLSRLLHNTTQGEGPRLLAPNDCVVLAYAISSRENFENYWEGKNTDDVVLQINLVSKDLRDFKNIRRSQQKALVGFCVNLSKEVMHHQMEYYPRKARLIA